MQEANAFEVILNSQVVERRFPKTCASVEKGRLGRK
jgi:hypothetical protein